MATTTSRVVQRWLARGAELIAGFRFAALVMALLGGFALLIALVLVVPDDAGAFGAFARDFKVWCFSYDPATGEMPATLALMMLSELVLFAALVAFLWWGPLRRAWREQRAALGRWSGGGLLGAFLLSLLLVLWSRPPAAEAATLTALRTEAPAPELALVDQSGARVRLADLDDKVVLVTALYATCGYTCPTLMAQAKRAVASLSEAERRELVVLAVTLDPAHDTPAVLAEMARAQGLAPPTWHFLSGPPAEVEATLDRWAFARRRDPESGRIEHANLFVLIDRDRRQAFRLSLSDEREAWLGEGLRLLIGEKRLAAGAR